MYTFNAFVLWPYLDVPIARLELGSSLRSDDIKEGDIVYLECHVQAVPPVSRLFWRHNVRLFHTKRLIRTFYKIWDLLKRESKSIASNQLEVEAASSCKTKLWSSKRWIGAGVVYLPALQASVLFIPNIEKLFLIFFLLWTYCTQVILKEMGKAMR